MMDHPPVPARRTTRCAVAVLAVALAASVTAGGSAAASTTARAATTPCTPGGTAAEQPVSPSVAALGDNERQQIVVYRGVGAAAGCLITARSDTGVSVHRLGIAKSSVPVVAEISGATIRYQIAFQANTGLLWTTGEDGRRNLRYGMSRLSSPSSYRDEIVFTSNRNQVYDVKDTGTKIQVLPLASSPGSTPALTLLAVPTPAGANRQYGRQIAYAAQITGGTPVELTAGVINRLYDIP